MSRHLSISISRRRLASDSLLETGCGDMLTERPDEVVRRTDFNLSSRIVIGHLPSVVQVNMLLSYVT